MRGLLPPANFRCILKQEQVLYVSLPRTAGPAPAFLLSGPTSVLAASHHRSHRPSLHSMREPRIADCPGLASRALLRLPKQHPQGSLRAAGRQNAGQALAAALSAGALRRPVRTRTSARR